MPITKQQFDEAKAAENIDLTAPTVQRVIQGLLDAWRELSMEAGRMQRATRWDIVNEGLIEGDRLNNQLKAALAALGLPITESRSK